MPRPFKLTVHLHKASGLYRKRIAGQDVYLGADHDEAIRELQAILDRRKGGEGQYADGSIGLAPLSQMFTDAMQTEVDEGRMRRHTATEYDRIIVDFLAIVGDRKAVRDLGPEDFARVRQAWRKRLGVYALNRYILAVRRLFNWSTESGIVRDLPKYGRKFELEPRSTVRAHRAKRSSDRGERKFTDDELRKIVTHPLCDGTLKTCVMLGLNCGFYAVDCSDLVWDDLREEPGGVLSIVRNRIKTEIPQHAPLWPELADRIRSLRRSDGRVLCRPDGGALVDRETDHDWLGKQFSSLYAAACGAKRDGVSFGALRHTHASAVGDHPDRAAKFMVRAHLLPEEAVEGVYDIPDLNRLQAVTSLAYERLWLRYLSAPAQSSDGDARRSGAEAK